MLELAIAIGIAILVPVTAEKIKRTRKAYVPAKSK
jgi:hypothetical protein